MKKCWARKTRACEVFETLVQLRTLKQKQVDREDQRELPELPVVESSVGSFYNH